MHLRKPNNGNIMPRISSMRRPRWYLIGALLIILTLFLASQERERYALQSENPFRRPPTPEEIEHGKKLDEAFGSGNHREPDLLTDVKSPNSTKRAFHLLVPAYEPSGPLCRTVLTSTILNYPPPVFITRREGKGHTKDLHRIQGIYEYLNSSQVEDNDLVLIVDSRDTWFQLPPNVMIQRYQELLRSANEDLWYKYKYAEEAAAASSHPDAQPRFRQTVVFGASKHCVLKDDFTPICDAIPKSTLGPKYFAYTPKPRYPDIGNILGPVSEVRELYSAGVKRGTRVSLSETDSQSLMTKLFGEQEFGRVTRYLAAAGTATRWREWLLSKAGWAQDVEELSDMILLRPDQQFDFGVGLDYASTIFQTLEESAEDIGFLKYNKEASLSDEYPNIDHHLPEDIANSMPPWISFFGAVEEPRKHTTLPFNESLDFLPSSASWDNVTLTTNIKVSQIPAVLYVHDDIPENGMGPFWQKLWYFPYLRALMRNRIRFTGGGITAHAAAIEGDSWWNARGGAGGMWTDKGVYASYGELCNGFENQIFGDGKGLFGHEDGDKPEFNKWGLLLSGVAPPKDKDKDKEKEKEKEKEEKEKEKEKSTPEENPDTEATSPAEDGSEDAVSTTAEENKNGLPASDTIDTLAKPKLDPPAVEAEAEAEAPPNDKIDPLAKPKLDPPAEDDGTTPPADPQTGTDNAAAITLTDGDASVSGSDPLTAPDAPTLQSEPGDDSPEPAPVPIAELPSVDAIKPVDPLVPPPKDPQAVEKKPQVANPGVGGREPKRKI